MRPNRLLIDIESLGFSENKSSIIEIAWLFVDPNYKPITGDSIYILPQAGKDADPKVVEGAAAINGYDINLWHERGAVELPEAQAKLAEVMAAYGSEDPNDRHLTWACNAPFDRRWVAKHFECMTPVIAAWNCSMPIARKYCGDTNIEVVKGTLTLAGQCKLAGSAYRNGHGGIEDCHSLAGFLQWAKALGRIE